jgi:hypothetical protein
MTKTNTKLTKVKQTQNDGNADHIPMNAYTREVLGITLCI